MTKQILPVFIPVTKQYEQVFFTVLLPKDTLFIAKIQVSVSLPTKGATNNGIAGTLQLQAIGASDICYYSAVKTDTTPVGLQIFGFPNGTQGIQTGLPSQFITWLQEPFIQWEKQVEEYFVIKGNDMMYGCYKDDVGGAGAQDMSYTINLFLHLILKD